MGLKSALCGAMQLHSLVSFSFKMLECENLKKKRKKDAFLHVFTCTVHFSRIFDPSPRIFSMCVSTCVLPRVCV